MSVRNPSPSLVVGAIIGFVVLLVVGGGAIGYLTLFADDSPNDGLAAPSITDSANLPSGYEPDHISAGTASDSHLARLSETAYKYEYYKMTYHPNGTQTKLTRTVNVSDRGEAFGTFRLRDGGQKTEWYVYSPDSAEYIEYKAGSTRQFGNYRYATGLELLDTVLTNGSVRTDSVDTDDAGNTWVRYELGEMTNTADSHGTLWVRQDGLIGYVSIRTQYEDGTRVSETVTITPKDRVSVTRPEWVDSG